MKKRILEEKRQEKQDNRDRNSATTSINPAISAQNIGNPSLNSPLAPPSMNALNTTASVFYFIILRPFLWEFKKKRWEIELWEAIGERHR
jgi:hypothetical protein